MVIEQTEKKGGPKIQNLVLDPEELRSIFETVGESKAGEFVNGYRVL